MTHLYTPLFASTDSVASTSPSARSKGTRSLTTTSRSKGGGRKGKTKRGRNTSSAPASRTKEETLHLIKLRDEMIEAKHQEVCTYIYGREIASKLTSLHLGLKHPECTF